MREQDKHFLWSIYVAIGVILIWKGIWEGLREIPYLGDPFALLFIGFAMLTVSGLIFKEFDPLGGLDKAATKVLSYVHNNVHAAEYEVKYHDKAQKKDLALKGNTIKNIEKGHLVIKHPTKNQEIFIPIDRVTEIVHQGKPYWRM